jgi:hypothetical protein
MKAWLLLPVALILGWGLGSWVPKRELRAARTELAAARKAMQGRGRAAPSFTGVTQMLGLEETRDGAPSPVGTNATTQVSDAPDHAAGETPTADATPEASPATDEHAPEPSMVRNIEQAMEVWEARVGIARATFVANARLTLAEADHFDLLVDAMNLRIATSIEQFVDHAQSGATVGEAEGIRLARDLTTAMAITYDGMDASMPEDWQGDAGQGFSLTAFVDPAVALPLTEVEGQLGSGFFMGGR